MKEKIILYSKSIGIDLIGFTSARVFNELKHIYMKSRELDYLCSFVKGDIDNIINPYLLLNDCKTIIAVGIGYPQTCKYLENLGDNEVYFSPSSWGRDYHVVLKEKLKQLEEYIISINPELNSYIQVDNGALDERYIAYLSGLGFYGKNNLLINEKLGSYFFIGLMLINLDVEPDNPVIKKCRLCNLCIKNCPGEALNEDGILNSKKCYSYITQKKVITKKEEEIFDRCIYGCDVCAKVCPYNKGINTKVADFDPTGVEFININTYGKLSNKKFKEKYGNLSGSWRGRKIIERNIELCKKHINS